MTTLKFILSMARREGRAGGRRLLLLTAAVSAGVAALVAIDSFSENLRTGVAEQSRALLGADLRIASRTTPTQTTTETVDSIAKQGGAGSNDVASVTGFAGMAYLKRNGATKMVRVTAVAGEYPLYGTVRTTPADRWESLTSAGKIALVDPSFLSGLRASIGDTLSLGDAWFVVAGTVDNFPGDVGIESAFGPRVFIPSRYLAETSLLSFGARAEYEWYLRFPDSTKVGALAKTWRTRINQRQLSLRTASDNEENLRSSLDQLGRYLGLVALIALLLGGIGVGSAVQVFLGQKRESIAVLRCLGATSRQLFAVYLLQAVIMGLIGSAVGVGLGLLLQLVLPHVFGQFLPLTVQIRPSARAVLTGLLIGLWVSTIFALLPLLRVRSVPPLEVLRRPYETARGERAELWTWLARITLVVSTVLLTIYQVGEVRKGLFFASAIGFALLVLWLAALGLIRGVRRWFPRRLPYVWRQGLANLYRPANQTVAVVLALGFGAFLLGALALVQHNLLRQLNLDAGPGKPNLVFFDIQPDQREGLADLLEQQGRQASTPVPIVPMRIRSINGRPVGEILADSAPKNREGEPIERWALRREFRSTYRDSIVHSEKVVVGLWWNGTQKGPVFPISMETGVATDLGVTVRDTIVWDVQGVSVTTRIASLREVNWARFEPNFFVVFPSGALEAAPQSYVVLTRASTPLELGEIQRQVVQRYSNITSIDLTTIQSAIERIVSSVVLAVRFMALFSLATGTIVLIGALATSRFQRVREAVLLKTLGAVRRQVLRIMLAEYAALGVLAALVAMALASAAGWALTKYVFEVPFSVPWSGFLALAFGMIALTLITGVWNSVEVFRRTAMEVLRGQE
ncbi:MAG TPA: FtsX-like permease family protein [Gemmatimonadales bacterium]